MSAETLHQVTLDWAAIHRDSMILAERVRPAGPFLGMVAVTRGGMVPAALMARALDVRMIETICISSYDGQARGEIHILKSARDSLGDGAGWLVIDDLVDSGATAKAVRAMLPQAHYATLYAKPDGLAQVQSFVGTFDQDVWIVFPWDVAP